MLPRVVGPPPLPALRMPGTCRLVLQRCPFPRVFGPPPPPTLRMPGPCRLADQRSLGYSGGCRPAGRQLPSTCSTFCSSEDSQDAGQTFASGLSRALAWVLACPACLVHPCRSQPCAAGRVGLLARAAGAAGDRRGQLVCSRSLLFACSFGVPQGSHVREPWGLTLGAGHAHPMAASISSTVPPSPHLTCLCVRLLAGGFRNTPGSSLCAPTAVRLVAA